MPRGAVMTRDDPRERSWCGKLFVPQSRRGPAQVFCCVTHQGHFWSAPRKCAFPHFAAGEVSISTLHPVGSAHVHIACTQTSASVTAAARGVFMTRRKWLYLAQDPDADGAKFEVGRRERASRHDRAAISAGVGGRATARKAILRQEPQGKRRPSCAIAGCLWEQCRFLH